MTTRDVWRKGKMWLLSRTSSDPTFITYVLSNRRKLPSAQEMIRDTVFLIHMTLFLGGIISLKNDSMKQRISKYDTRKQVNNICINDISYNITYYYYS